MMQLLPALVIPYPMIDPVLVEIGPLAIRWYALAYVAGILLGWWYAVRLINTARFWRKWGGPPLTPVQIDDFIVWATLGIILGGRIGFILFYGIIYQPALYSDPMQWLKIWEGGMSFHGGLIGVVIAVMLFSWRKGIDMVRFGDVVASVAPIGLFTGRIANFVNGELWGKVTDVPWAMVFPTRYDAAGNMVSDPGPFPRHPSQIYEALLEGVLLFLILRLLATRFRAFDRPGILISAFLFFYGLFRIIGEVFRDSDQLIAGGAFSMGQLLSALMWIGALFFAWWAMSHRPKTA